MATPPIGTRIQFTVTTSGPLYMRGGDTALGPPSYTEIQYMAAGTHEVDVTLSLDPAVYPRFGFLTPSVPTTVSISNWRVTGSGSQGAINADVGKGGDGFLFLVVRADQASVVTA